MLIDKTVKITAILVGAFVLFGVTHPALAQTAGVVTLAVNPTQGTASVIPTLTWSTTPAAIGCVASGGWTGTKAASGTLVLPAVTASTSYTLDCSWSGGTGSKVVSWTAPTLNTDGSPLTNLASFKILYGGTATALTASKAVAGAGTASDTVTGLANGSWYFTVRAVNASGVESDNGNVAGPVVVSVAPVTASKTVSLTVNPKPNPPGSISVTDPIVRNIQVDFQRWAFVSGPQVGTVIKGTPCDPARQTIDGFNVISDNTKITPRPASATYALVAKCG